MSPGKVRSCSSGSPNRSPPSWTCGAKKKTDKPQRLLTYSGGGGQQDGQTPRVDPLELTDTYTSPLANEDRTITCPNAEKYGCKDLWIPDLYGEFAGVCETCGHHFPLEHTMVSEKYLRSRLDQTFQYRDHRRQPPELYGLYRTAAAGKRQDRKAFRQHDLSCQSRTAFRSS